MIAPLLKYLKQCCSVDKSRCGFKDLLRSGEDVAEVAFLLLDSCIEKQTIAVEEHIDGDPYYQDNSKNQYVRYY